METTHDSYLGVLLDSDAPPRICHIEINVANAVAPGVGRWMSSTQSSLEQRNTTSALGKVFLRDSRTMQQWSMYAQRCVRCRGEAEHQLLPFSMGGTGKASKCPCARSRRSVKATRKHTRNETNIQGPTCGRVNPRIVKTPAVLLYTPQNRPRSLALCPHAVLAQFHLGP